MILRPVFKGWREGWYLFSYFYLNKVLKYELTEFNSMKVVIVGWEVIYLLECCQNK